MATNTELINQATGEIIELRSRVAQLERLIEQYDLLKALNRITALEQHVGQLSAKASEADALREQVAVLKAEMSDLKKAREQSDNRLWNVLMIAIGAVLSLVGGMVVQLVAFAIKK